MPYFVKKEELALELDKHRAQGKTIGFVPTMGALHDGHLSLLRHARECDVVVASIFVNPLQFNNQKDLDQYPRDLKVDREKLEGLCDVLFAPSKEEIYPNSVHLSFNFGALERELEGRFRPGHFNGMAVVVSKFFNIIAPDKAYFGKKDLQQLMIVRQLVSDLNFQIEIIGCPIEREKSGLAMSSRNQRLSKAGNQIATNIFKGLNKGEIAFSDGSNLEDIKTTVTSFYETIEGLDLEYCEIVDEQFNLLKTTPAHGGIAMCVAAKVEGVRLIDNVYLRSQI